MVRDLLIRGMLAGLLAGILAFGFARLVGEPQVDIAIAFESHMDAMKGMAPDEEIVSRAVQASVGLATAVLVYGTAFGGLFALVFAFAYGRVGRVPPRALASLLAGAAYLVIVVVPDLKYPPNPPAIGDPDTIGDRTALFFAMIMAAVLALLAALWAGRLLAARLGVWNATLAGAAVFIALVTLVQFALPDINEVPDGFPASTLWRFRLASLGVEALLWTTIGLTFGALAEKRLKSSGLGSPG